MVERLLEHDAISLDTPYLRRIREEGREEGALAMRRRDILQALELRFGPPEAVSPRWPSSWTALLTKPYWRGFLPQRFGVARPPNSRSC
jgi:hypothetical protein